MNVIINVPANSFYSRYNGLTFEACGYLENSFIIDLVGITQGFGFDSFLIVDFLNEFRTAEVNYQGGIDEFQLLDVLINYANFNGIRLS
jgi:hypothetical protein